MPVDMVVREFANGFWAIALTIVGTIFVQFAWREKREMGRCSPQTQASMLVGIFMVSAALMRVWAWLFLWQANHGMQPTWREEWWLALLSIVLGSFLLPFLIYRITPPRAGHQPWILAVVLAWGIPIIGYIIPYLLGW